jgi:hypothetical protein
MTFITRAALSAIALLLVAGIAGATEEQLSPSDKASLQASMQQHIDRNLVGGAYLYFDPSQGEVSRIYPVVAHPMMMRMGEFFVLCSDFRDATGASVPVDFYMARRGKAYVVFQALVAQRAQLEVLIKAGKVRPAG